MNRCDRQAHGYVLVLTLALLVLVSAALVCTGRLAVERTAIARQAERDLQRRAAVASCREAILPQAERILATQELLRKSPLVQHRAQVRLGGFTLEIILADEQAKASVNALLSSAPVEIVETRLREALSGSGLGRAVALRPTASREGVRVGSLGQVLERVEPRALLERVAGRPSVSEWLTCWGSGAINARRASEAALRLALVPPWTPLEVSRLMEARGEMFGDAGSVGTPAARTQPSQRDPLLSLLQIAQIRANPAGLSLKSDCHSLWIITRDGRRQWYDLAVREESGEQSPRVMTFSW